MTDFLPSQIESLTHILGFAIASAVASLLCAPLLIKILRRYGIARKSVSAQSLVLDAHPEKMNTPIMGGILVIATIIITTYFFNWDRQYTWVPIGVLVIASLLGAIDDLLNIFGGERRQRSLAQVVTLIRVHKRWYVKAWFVITFPWTLFKRATTIFGSKQRTGVLVHEKLLLQFAAGAVSAWWIYYKLGEAWQDIYVPFHGYISIGILIVPLIILIVMFTANAVNISDGMDGLAGGMLIPTFGALSFLAWISGYDALAVLNAVTAGSLISYTYFNIKPARFQMGDVGSLGLGALLAINALAVNSMAILPFIAFMFYAEAITVIIQTIGRHVFGRRVFRMAPLHHHLELCGWSEEKTIMRLWIIHFGFVLLGVWIGLH
ncbi:MAG: phospho-N-acetylmuramoyl-pentapeptide transferase [Candidatus Parcubacteria bacterium]|jgi:phospho-N-acetylmuramoyl-pentapeptide-transferase